ncbi:carboxypeptidase M-like [Pelobates fuscus]|uniref:carboxypeptidase M-like n=1 Tax=Pelobates fuscus TaxID=191477 RepID=UPI002FE46427
MVSLISYALVLNVLLPTLCTKNTNLPFKYHTEKELEATLRNLNEMYPTITHLYSIGQSVQGVPLWVLCVGRFPDVHRMGIPEVKYIANIHGNEPVGRELLLHFINYLVHNYKHNEDIEALVNSTRIHFLPALNPDGFKTSVPGDCQGSHGRANFNNIDLNRNFPSIFGHNLSPLQPETLAAMQWFQSETFVLSATLHGGALVAVYPFSFSVEGHRGKAKSPDDEIFKYLTKTYANAHKTMHKGDFCNETFPGGITNAAAWYPVLGCLQDYNYIKGQCFEITLEVSCCKYPREDQLPRLWDENKQALLELIKQVHKGIKGRVVDTSGNSVPKATIQFTTRKKKYVYQANNYGEFYKILIPGKYKVRVKAQGYLSETKLVVVTDKIISYSAITQNFILKKQENKKSNNTMV